MALINFTTASRSALLSWRNFSTLQRGFCPCGADWTNWGYGGRTQGYAPTSIGRCALHAGALHAGALPPPKSFCPCGADWTNWGYGGRTRGYAPTTNWTNWTN